MTTLICVVGHGARSALHEAAASANNLTIEIPSIEHDDPLGRSSALIAAWKRAATHGSVFTAVPADPLAVVIDQWALRLEGRPHDLELSIGMIGDAPTPDYWIVPDDLPAPHAHWYYDHLLHQARGRVLLEPVKPDALRRTIGSLTSAPLPPRVADLAQSARNYVPAPGIGTSPEHSPAELTTVGGHTQLTPADESSAIA